MRKVFHTGRTQSGAVMLMVAIALTALLAMAALVIDIGLLYVARQNAQNIADQCAVSSLAAINNYANATVQGIIVESEIKSVSRRLFAAYPSMTAEKATLSDDIMPVPMPKFYGVGFRQCIRNDSLNPPLNFETQGEKDFNVSVQTYCTIPVDMTFGKILGMDRQEVSATAVARLYFVPRLTYNYVPWAIKYKMVFPPPNEGEGPPVGKIMPGRLLVPGASDPPGEAGGAMSFEIIAVELPGGYENRLAGDAEPIEMGTDLPAEPPETAKLPSFVAPISRMDNFGSATYTALQDRFGADPGVDNGAYDNWRQVGEATTFADHDRIMMTLIIDETPEANGTYKVRGFAPLFVTRYDAQTGDIDFVLLSCLYANDRVRWNLKVKPVLTTSMVSKVMLYDFGTTLSRY